jgi:hypothetical protein
MATQEKRTAASRQRLEPTKLGEAEFFREMKRNSRQPRKRTATCAYLSECSQPPYQQRTASIESGAEILGKLAPSLESLSSIQDVWDKICWHSSGSSVVSMSQVSRSLRNATVQSPAYVFLAGRDADGFLVRWQDPSNILAPTTIYRGWNPTTHFRLRTVYQAHEYDRMIQVQRAVEDFYNWRSDDQNPRTKFLDLSERRHQIYLNMGFFPTGNYSFGAPARPSSACSNVDMGYKYVYRLRNPCERVLSPTLFPPKEHKVSEATRLRRLYATPDDDATSSSISSYGSDNDDL